MSENQIATRETIDEKYKWDLRPIFSIIKEWENSRENIKNQIKSIEQFRDKVTKSPENLADTLIFVSNLQEQLRKLSCYASLASDEDTRVNIYQGMKQEVGQIYADFSAAASFIEPEILRAKSDSVLDFIEKEERLKDFDFYLKDLIRQRKHIRSDEVEKVIAQASLMSGNASSIYSIFSNADFPYPEISLSTGEKVILNNANFALHRASRN